MVKNIIKKVLPKQMQSYIRNIKNNINLIRYYNYDRKKFQKAYTREIEKASKEQLEAKMMFHSHAIEKGLSHNELRYKFGESALTQLASTMEAYRRRFDTNNLRYQIALSCIRNYELVHINNDIEITDFLRGIFSENILQRSKEVSLDLGGYENITSESKKRNNSLSFRELAKNRYSIREFSEDKVSLDDIKEAVEISLKTPSVCNRQPSKVLIIRDKKVMEQVLSLQGGYTGYKLPPCLLLITASNNAFVGINERNEGYIDGGLFAMSILYSLEYKSLAACALNAMMSVKKEKQIKKILQLKDSDLLIMFIAVGGVPGTVKVATSTRNNLTEVLSIV